MYGNNVLCFAGTKFIVWWENVVLEDDQEGNDVTNDDPCNILCK